MNETKANPIARAALAIRDLLEDGHKICFRCPLDHLAPDSSNCWSCRNFMRIPYESRKCPCGWYGKEEAVKRAWIYLEEGGYLDE